MIVSSGVSTPTPSYRRMMAFIDGENLTFSYQQSLENGFHKNSGILHKPDTYVWHQQTIQAVRYEVIRATYYTFAVGDDDALNEISNQIKNFNYAKDGMSQLPNNLRPQVFKKDKQGKKTKGVDIQITVDILSNVYNDNLDTVYLVTGDGDFLPIINEAIRHGKQVYLAAFSTGLNKKLLNHVDHFIDLDKIYFQ